MKDQFDAAADNGILTKVYAGSLASNVVGVLCFGLLIS